MGEQQQKEKEILTDCKEKGRLKPGDLFVYYNSMELHFLSVFQKLSQANVC